MFDSVFTWDDNNYNNVYLYIAIKSNRYNTPLHSSEVRMLRVSPTPVNSINIDTLRNCDVVHLRFTWNKKKYKLDKNGNWSNNDSELIMDMQVSKEESSGMI